MRAFLIFMPFLIFANIESHLKRAENKSDIHKLENVDFIYMINLDERPGKWEFCNRQLNPYAIFPYRFSAVNGWTLPIEVIRDVALTYENWMASDVLSTVFVANGEKEERLFEIASNEGTPYFTYGMSRGVVGIVLSHLSILKDALDSNYETIWVMEDDIEVISDPRGISSLIERLDNLVGKDHWDILFTDRNTKDKNGEVPARGAARRPNFTPPDKSQYYIDQKVGKDFIRLGARFGAYSMILRRSGIRKIYDFILSHSVFLPYDMDFYLPPGIQIYTVADDVVSTVVGAPSDNTGPHY